jgi:hypothetical protein
MKLNWAITSNSIIVNFNGKTKNISSENKGLHDKVLAAIKEGRNDDIPSILDVTSTINVKSNKNIEIRDGYVYIDGDVVNNTVAERILQYYNNNIPYNGLVEFWRNLKQNPSYRARERLFLFLENGGHPFTDDGHFIAYKAVTNNFKDVRTSTIDNSIGAKPVMDRAEISDDPTVTCAPGLHVASFAYLPACYSGGHTYVCVKVNPKNVVSIPVDYHNQKMRVCEYEVISLSDGPLKEIHYPTAVPTPDPVVEPEAPTEPVEEPSSSSSESEESSSSSSSSSSESEEETETTPAPAPVVEPEENKDSDSSVPPGFVSSEAIAADPDESESESSSSEEY